MSDRENGGMVDRVGYVDPAKDMLSDYGNDCSSTIMLATLAKQNEKMVRDVFRELKERNGGKLLLTIQEAKPQKSDAIEARYPDIYKEINRLVAEINQLEQTEGVPLTEILEKMKAISALIKTAK